MGSKKDYGYSPDYAVPPGESLLETIQALGMSQAELAARTGRPVKTISEIINGKESITPRTALQFERVLGVPASFWNNLERNYREALERIEERKRLADQVEWLKKLPVRSMAKLGWIRPRKEKTGQVEELLNFFGVASPAQWEEMWRAESVAFRKSPAFQSEKGAVAAWLRKGELDAKAIDCAPYDEGKFRDALVQIRLLTREPLETLLSEIKRLCAEAGVAVVFVPELEKTRVSGATRWLSPIKALIQLSFRYKSDDHLLFTFFHEAGHILRHGKRDVFIEGDDTRDGKESEADRFARDFLIPSTSYQQLVRLLPRSVDEVRRAAEELNIAPGIVVGRLQHDAMIPMNFFNELKRHVDWKRF
ncbi:MAG: HigA family addiction module antitoxin [Thermodesulfobacteriota bacterium]